MSTRTAVAILAFTFLGGIFLLSNWRFLEKNIPATKSNEQTSTKQNWEAKIDEQGNVTVTITPIDILASSSEWKFNVEINTHSVELENPMLSTVLVDGRGNEYKPIVWDGPTEGHHMNGVLTFASITPIPKSIKIKISGLGGVTRSFIW